MADTVSRTYFRNDGNRRRQGGKNKRPSKVAESIKRRGKVLTNLEVALTWMGINLDRLKVAKCPKCEAWFETTVLRNDHRNKDHPPKVRV